ncbi:MAG: hypothetical protein ACI835_005089, partial [Planctomycetota bacterium]
ALASLGPKRERSGEVDGLEMGSGGSRRPLVSLTLLRWIHCRLRVLADRPGNPPKKTHLMRRSILSIPCTLLLVASTQSCQTNGDQEQVSVKFENYNQAETARNFNNWAKLGGGNEMLHLKELSPIGPDAPTIRMNLDTLYSVGVYDNDGEMSVTIPQSALYQSVMIIDTDGYTPFFFVEPGTHAVKNDSEFLFIAVRTAVEDRHDKASFEAAHKAQAGIKVEGNGSKPYEMPAFNQEELHALTVEYNTKMLESKLSFVYGDGVTPVNEEHRSWSNAAGWGGMVTEIGKSNTYNSSENLPGETPFEVTFPDPGNKFFTSFTIYDTDGYLMEGNSHINSYTWKPNDDGSITIHFNAEGMKNNLTSNGVEFNYIVRNYGASQAVIDLKINPVKPEPVK